MMMRAEGAIFDLTEELLTLLREGWVSQHLSPREYGAAEIDPKRPYGNSDVELDIAVLLGFEVIDGTYVPDAVAKRCRLLHEQTPVALQIVLSTGEFRAGTYRPAKPYGKRWLPVEGPLTTDEDTASGGT